MNKQKPLPEQPIEWEPYNRVHTRLPSGRPIWIEVPGRLTAEDKAWLLRLIDLFLVVEEKEDNEQ